jgi:hypothetical protein
VQERGGRGQDRAVGVALRGRRQRVVVVAEIEEVGVVAELVPDFDIEVVGAIGARDEVHRRADVLQPAAQRRLELGIRRTVGKLRLSERLIEEGRSGV